MNNGPVKYSDAELIQIILDGNINAFAQLITRYKDHVLKIVKKHVPYDKIEDLSQEVFIRIYQSLKNLKKNNLFKQWISTIAVRTCYEYWRKEYKNRELPMSTLSDEHLEWMEKVISDQSGESYIEYGSQKEARELLDWALDQLSAEDRIVLELVYLEEHSVKQAAQILGWSVANVKVRSFRSRKKLEKLLSGIIKR